MHSISVTSLEFSRTSNDKHPPSEAERYFITGILPVDNAMLGSSHAPILVKTTKAKPLFPSCPKVGIGAYALARRRQRGHKICTLRHRHAVHRDRPMIVVYLNQFREPRKGPPSRFISRTAIMDRVSGTRSDEARRKIYLAGHHPASAVV